MHKYDQKLFVVAFFDAIFGISAFLERANFSKNFPNFYGGVASITLYKITIYKKSFPRKMASFLLFFSFYLTNHNKRLMLYIVTFAHIFRRFILILAFSSVKGGVGKSSLSCNLGYFFSQKGKKILLIDFDAQAGATHHLSYKFEQKFKASITDVLNNRCKIQTSIHEYTKQFHFIPANFNFYEIASTNFEPKLSEIISEVKQEYDFLFFDLSPAIHPGVTIPLSLSDYAIVPVDTSGGLSILGLKSEQRLIAEVRKKGDVELLGIIPNFVENTRMSKDSLAFLQKNYSDIVLPPIRCNTHIAQASSVGKTIFEYKKSSVGAKDYTTVGIELLKRLGKKGGIA